MPHTPLTDELADQIAATVEAGLWPRESAILHGAARWQWESWSELGERLNEASAAAIVAGEPQDVLTAHEQACLELVRKVDIAEATCQQTWLNRWLTVGATGRGNGWTAFASLLERRFPNQWAKRPAEPPKRTRDPRSLEDILDEISDGESSGS